MDTVQRISQEVHRILISPYEVSLKKLRDTLIHASQPALQYWAYSQPCQINGLAIAILDALEYSPFVLEILRILSCIIPFRDQVLEQRPMLLHTLLTEVTASEQGFDKYAATCVSLVSAAVQIPESTKLALFIGKLLDKATQSPSVESIRPLYVVLSGAASGFLDDLPADSVTRLQDQLIRMLRGLAVEDHSSDLLCLAILAILAFSEPPNSDLLPDSDSSPLLRTLSSGDRVAFITPERYKAARQFFNTSRASKMLDLVVLKVILACSRGCNLCLSEIVESMKLSEEITNKICVEEKKSWMAKNSAKAKKLFEKILRPDIELEIQYAAINFTMSLTEGQSFPFELVDLFKNNLCTLIPFIHSPRGLERYFGESDESTINRLLMELFELACTELVLDTKSFAKLKNAIAVVSGLALGVQTSANLRQAILFSLSTNSLSKSLHHFLSKDLFTSLAHISHNGSRPCPCSFSKMCFNLRQAIRSLVLKTALHASHEEISLDFSVSDALLNTHEIDISKFAAMKCDFYSLKPMPLQLASVPPLTSEGLPLVNLLSREWKDILFNEMSVAMKNQHDSVLKIVRDVTQDLEDRCNNAELPFRNEQEKSKELGQKVSSLETELEFLRSQMEEKNIHFDQTHQENVKLSDQVEIAARRFQDLSSTYEALQRKFGLVEQEALESARIADENLKQNDLAHIAILTGKDELYEKQTLRVSDLEARIANLAEKIQEMQLQQSTAEEKLSCLQELIHTRDEELEGARQSEASKQKEIDRFNDLQENWVVEKQKLVTQLNDSEGQCQLLSSDLVVKASAYENEMAALRLEHKTQMAAKESEALQQNTSHEIVVMELRKELEKAKENISSIIRENDAILVESEKKMSKLIREREKRETEFAQVKDLSNKLITVMELRQAQDSAEERIEKMAGHPFDKNTQDRHPPDATFGVPTPKLTKTRRSFKSSVVHTKRRAEIAIEKGEPDSQRYALKDLGLITQNVRPTTSTQRLSQTDAQMIHIHKPELGREIENVNVDMGEPNGSFNDSDIITSTDQHQYGIEHENFGSHIYEDTTVDF